NVLPSAYHQQRRVHKLELLGQFMPERGKGLLGLARLLWRGLTSLASAQTWAPDTKVLLLHRWWWLHALLRLKWILIRLNWRLVDEHRTSRVSSAVNGKQPCEEELNTLSATRPAGWKPPAGQVEPRLLRPAWSQQRDQPVRGMMWCPVVPPRKPPQAPRSSQAAPQPAASEPGPSTPQPAKRSKRTKAEPKAAEPTKGKGKGKAAKAKPAPQPGRWLDRDCNAALNMQRIGESRWRPLELCFWPDQGALPVKGKEYPGLGYKRLRDKPPKAQQQQQQPAEAQQAASSSEVASLAYISRGGAGTRHKRGPPRPSAAQERKIAKGLAARARPGKTLRIFTLKPASALTMYTGVPMGVCAVCWVCRSGYHKVVGKPKETDWCPKTVVLVDERRNGMQPDPTGFKAVRDRVGQEELGREHSMPCSLPNPLMLPPYRTSRVSSAVNGKQPCEEELNTLSATRPAGWKPPAGQVEPRLLRPAWSQQRGQPVRGMMWCPVVAPRKPPQAPRSSQAAPQPAASEPGPSTPQPAKRSKRTKAEPKAAEPTKGKGKGKAAKAKPAPQPGRWLDRDCNAALNMQRIGESRWRPLELCFWPDQGALPAKGKEYLGLGYKRLRDKPPKAQQQQQQQQPAEAQLYAFTKAYQRLRKQLYDPLPKYVQLRPEDKRRGHVPIAIVQNKSPVRQSGKLERIVKLYAKAARAQLGWSGEEAQLFIRMACGYGINAHSSELKAATLDKGHVADLIEEANTHRRLLGKAPCRTPCPCPAACAMQCMTLTCPPPFTLTPVARVGVHFIKVDSRVLHGVCKQLGLTKETRAAFTSEPALSHHWARWFNTNKLRNKEFAFERLVDTDGVSVCVHYTRPLPPAPPPAASSSSTSSRPSAAAAAAHALGLPHVGRGIAEMREFVFDPATQIGVGIDPGVTQAVSAASGVWDPQSGQLMADQLRRWKLTKGQVKHDSGLNNARRDTERWLAPIKPHLQHLAAASSAGTSLEANLKHITVTLATWDAVWEVYLDPKWARQRLRLYGAQDRALEQFFKVRLEEKMAELSMERHNHAKQLVVFFGAASIGTAGGWGADAVLRACRKVVCRPRDTDQLRGRVVLVDEHRTTRVSSAVNGKQPCEEELNTLSATRPAGWKPPAGQVEPRLLRPAWSQRRGQPVRGMMWCPVVDPRKPPQAPRSSQAATPTAASEPGPSTPQPAKRSKRTKAEPEAAEPTKGKGKGKAAKAKPAPQPGRWLDRDCNAALNMQRIGESRWRLLELCFWPDQGALPVKGKEYPGLGYKRLRDKPPKAQ
ncbi:hypothetical protein QJQ45_027317, partial [Haematococcus lacustris]